MVGSLFGMMTTTIVPGLALDETLYEAAAAGVASHVPGLPPLTWERFAQPDAWTLVPDGYGQGYKAEFVLEATPVRTLKVNLWNLPDLRGGDKSTPHSHPWDFRAYVLLGGYSEDRYVPEGATVRAERAVEHRAGGVNDVPRAVYHEVTEVHAPGRTLTLMVCGRGQRGSWGYLDVATGRHQAVGPDPGFADRQRALNPHRD